MIAIVTEPRVHPIDEWNLPYQIRVFDVTEKRFVELVDENTKAELLDGVMIVHSPATIEHDKVGAFVRTLMQIFAKRRHLGEVYGPDSLAHLRSKRLFCPDAFFIEARRVPSRKAKQFEGAPNLIVEVLSPSNRRYDLGDKLPAYEADGVAEIWFIDLAEEEVLIHRKRGRQYEKQVISRGKVLSSVLRGFWLESGWLWQDPLPDEIECLKKILKR